MANAAQMAASGDRVAQAHARLVNDSSIQFAFSQAPAEPRTPDWLRPLIYLFKAIAPVMPYVFWGGLIVAAGLLVWFVAREALGLQWGRRPKADKVAVPQSEWRPAPEQARVLLEDADRLAAEGRYAEAAHLLLLRTIGDIQGRRPDLVRPALTSRDIGRLPALPANARPAFRSIAEVVERSLFGGRPVDADAFAACRRAYANFALPGAWG